MYWPGGRGAAVWQEGIGVQECGKGETRDKLCQRTRFGMNVSRGLLRGKGYWGPAGIDNIRWLDSHIQHVNNDSIWIGANWGKSRPSDKSHKTMKLKGIRYSRRAAAGNVFKGHNFKWVYDEGKGPRLPNWGSRLWPWSG